MTHQNWYLNKFITITLFKYRGQTTLTRYTKILDCKFLINTSCCVGHRLELKYFLLAHVFLDSR